ncbi:hypothetical protein F2P79_006587 [Pimephales promelas]|nr:hypothetical protein F2P79_006587 [Pimephales promelas]
MRSHVPIWAGSEPVGHDGRTSRKRAIECYCGGDMNPRNAKDIKMEKPLVSGQMWTVKRLPLGGTEDFFNFAPETERFSFSH